MALKSHIQVPNFILKNFRDSTGRVNYLDLTSDDLMIRASGSDRLGTEENYYSEEIEQLLSAEIERPFSLLVKTINDFLQSEKTSIELSMSVEDDCKKYIAASAVRSNLALDSFLQGSITAQFCSDQDNHDSIVAFSIMQDNEIMKQLNDYTITIIVNGSSQKLVVPRNCFYMVMSNGFQCIVTPISPTCAFALLPKGYFGNLSETGRIAYIDTSEDIKIMNTYALQFEYTFNKSFVASSSRDELVYLKRYVQDNREKLEKSWTVVRK